jgi:hypothetical protein
MSEHRVIEIHPAQLLQALGLTQHAESPGAGLADHRRVKGSPTEVIDRYRAPRLDPLLHCIASRGSLRLGREPDLSKISIP